MPARKPPLPNEKPQRERFIETARETEASEDAADFESVFAGIVKGPVPDASILSIEKCSKAKKKGSNLVKARVLEGD